jgi:threonine dehydrogenase-like Zn-dependent dehydrogenase
VALGAAFFADRVGDSGPRLDSGLRVGDKVVSPFTVSCGECHFCRIGATCRCVHNALFGTPTLPGGQAQFIRVPKAGGTLVRISGDNGAALDGVADSALLLLGDILPTGVFAALQALQHPKLLPILTGIPYPGSLYRSSTSLSQALFNLHSVEDDDKVLTIAVVGLGPVGLCATISLIHFLSQSAIAFHVIAIDLLATRREKMKAIFKALDLSATSDFSFAVCKPDEAPGITKQRTGGVGCNAVLEVVGHPSALELSYDLVRPFGVISSVGVHQAPPLSLTGRDVYNKNVTLEFGRCPVRAVLPLAIDVLKMHSAVFSGVGSDPFALVERIEPIGDAAHWYERFDKGQCGKVLFDPWA